MERLVLLLGRRLAGEEASDAIHFRRSRPCAPAVVRRYRAGIGVRPPCLYQRLGRVAISGRGDVGDVTQSPRHVTPDEAFWRD